MSWVNNWLAVAGLALQIVAVRAVRLLLAALWVAAENVNGLIVVVGLATVCGSVAQWSRPAAGVIAGVMLTTIGLWPYLRPRGGD